ncbi:MAG: hypothetical protein A2751_04940 [Candidatus Doudnabacteria bacterium RIFCSPHIGHO2_01_FULL_46_14]|uniref:EamA domain-containing protein n=1 Tax=Candidatus Doudnabacteria bacterium RIFCSPHIGHO2_01_FULL_46_14 TaxID=1817824 RepID=A0A1F5NNQ2_9BACT|nr:MAG: hypothetical protein A2751_04940 [Candidatus Doudnabacteria bacterium RIFCSPHIGHO2_01_FULL_46_14]
MNKLKLAPFLVVIAAMLWAVDAPFRVSLTKDLSATTIVLMEHITIAVLVFVFLFRYLKELKNLGAKEWMAVIFIGFGGSALATVLFTQSFFAFNFMPTVPILLQKVQPFFAVVLASIFLKERMGKGFWALALLGMFGAYLVTYPDAKLQEFSLQGQTVGALLALGAAFLWAASTVFGRVVLKKISFQAMTAVRFLSALVFLFLINVYYGKLGEIGNATSKDWYFVFIIAILAGFVSLFIYYLGLRSTKASIATICELAFPFSAVIVNWKFLGATLSWVQIAGGLILLAAVVGLSLVNSKQGLENFGEETSVV